MAQILEFSFYIGVLLSLIALAWLISTIVRHGFTKATVPVCLLLLGATFIVGPAVLTRTLAVDLGPRDKIVQNERHISLTGWDGESYEFLRDVSNAVVLQMANVDVTDETVAMLVQMKDLRELDLNDSSITDSSLPVLASLPSLETLRLRSTAITDAGFREHLMNADQIRRMDLRQTDVLPDTVEEWKSKAGVVTGEKTRRAFQ